MIVFIVTFAGSLGVFIPVAECVLCFLRRRRKWVNDYLEKQAAQPEALDPENLESGAAQVQVEESRPTQQQNTAPTAQAKAKPKAKASAAQDDRHLVPSALSWLFTIRNLEWQLLSDELQDAMKVVVLRRLTQEMHMQESSGRLVVTKNTAAGSEDTVKVSGRLALPPRALGEKPVDLMREAAAKKAKLAVAIRSAIQDDINAIERIDEAKADKSHVVAVGDIAVSIIVKSEAEADKPANGAAASSDKPANGDAASSGAGGDHPSPPVSKWRQNNQASRKEEAETLVVKQDQREGLWRPEEAASPEEDLLAWGVGCGGEAANAEEEAFDLENDQAA